MDYKKITIIGAGSMGGAICKALAQHGKFSITAVNSSEEKLQDLFGSTLGKINTSTGYESLSDADVVVIAVKPQSFNELSEKIASFVNKESLFISIMAGKKIETIKNKLGIEKIIRSMPNLGAQFGESMTIWTSGGLTEEDMVFAEDFFNTIGKQLYVSNEDSVDKATAITASGAGFFAYMVEAYSKEVEGMGFSKKEADLMTIQTLSATATALSEGDVTPEEFRVKVTSKKGTTEAGLKVLMKKRLSGIFRKTLKSAYKRAKDISNEK